MDWAKIIQVVPEPDAVELEFNVYLSSSNLDESVGKSGLNFQYFSDTKRLVGAGENRYYFLFIFRLTSEYRNFPWVELAFLGFIANQVELVLVFQFYDCRLSDESSSEQGFKGRNADGPKL